MVLRPGFEPGISDSKGQNACPDYTTGARVQVRGLANLYTLPGAHAILKPIQRPAMAPPRKGRLVSMGIDGPKASARSWELKEMRAVARSMIALTWGVWRDRSPSSSRPRGR